MNKKAVYKISYGLFVLTASEGDKDNGCIVNTVIQLTSDPMQIAVTVNKGNLTHDMIKHQNSIMQYHRWLPSPNGISVRYLSGAVAQTAVPIIRNGITSLLNLFLKKDMKSP